MVVLPVAYDQPGVGARLEWSGAGRSIPVGRLTVDRLRDAVRIVLGNPAYRERACRLRSSIEAADGLNRAVDVIEAAFGMGWGAVPSETGRHAGSGSIRPQDRR
jgi:UDP:flavonoid glycosyltransferase YjiC (YdhE family)